MNKREKAVWRAIYGLQELKRLTDEDVRALEKGGDEKIRKEDELLERWQNLRILRIFGNGISVLGNTYPVKEILKDWKFQWNGDEWYNNLEDFSAKQLLKLAYEIGAEIEIEELPPKIWNDVVKGIPNVERVYGNLLPLAEKKDDFVWRISVDRVVSWKKERDMGSERERNSGMEMSL